MDDIRIPCIVWLYGDPPPDVSNHSDPIRIPFTIRPETGSAAPRPRRSISGSHDTHGQTNGNTSAGEHPGHDVPAVAVRPRDAKRTPDAEVAPPVTPVGWPDGYSENSDGRSHRTHPVSSRSGASIPTPRDAIDAANVTTDATAAARGLRMSTEKFRRAIHALKDAAGSGGADNVHKHIPSGDAYFNDENIGNLRDE
jgi:hypothetical protein